MTGYLELLAAGIDPIAVEQAVNGEHVALTPQEVAEAWRRLEAQGLCAREIGERLRVAPRSVVRWRSGTTPIGPRERPIGPRERRRHCTHGFPRVRDCATCKCEARGRLLARERRTSRADATKVR